VTPSDYVAVIIALLGTVSACFAAWMGYLANRRLRTNGGHTIGEHVEKLAHEIEAITKTTPPEPPTAV
jgi:hypothetical protein